MNATEGPGPRLLSLFTGAGGLDLGLEQAGFTTVAANELEPHACETLVANQLLPKLTPADFDAWFRIQLQQKCYSDAAPPGVAALRTRLLPALARSRGPLAHARILNGDIRRIPSRTLAEAAGVQAGDLDLIAGGPPCQPFSRAGKRETVEAEAGQLFLEFVRVVSDLRPRWFLFENVKGLLLHRTDVVRVRCRGCARRTVVPFAERCRILAGTPIGWTCACGRTDSDIEVDSPKDGSLELVIAEFERAGYRCQWRVLNAVDFGAPQFRERLFIVGSRDGEAFSWPTPTHSRAVGPGSQSTLFPDTTARSWQTLFDACWAESHPEFGKLDLRVARLWVKNVVRPHAEPVTWELTRPAPTIGAHQAAKLAIAPDGVPDEQLLRQQWHVKGKRQRDLPPVPVRHAYLSDEELLTIQTFPRSWYLFGTRMQRAFQIGNAVPVVLARAVGTSLLSASNSSSRRLHTEAALAD